MLKVIPEYKFIDPSEILKKKKQDPFCATTLTHMVLNYKYMDPVIL